MENRWTEEFLFYEGDPYFRDLVENIDRAQTSVDLETYIFKADPIGRLIEEALIRATRRGVKVRLLVDGLGANAWINKRNLDLETSGVEIRIFHPVFMAAFFGRLIDRMRSYFFGSRDQSLGARRRSVFFRINRRDHRKLCVVDQQMAWVGSLNIAADHSEQFASDQNPNANLESKIQFDQVAKHRAWRDTAIRIRGEAVLDLAAAFEYVWLRAHSLDHRYGFKVGRLTQSARLKRSPMSSLVRLNTTAHLRRRNFRAFLMQLRSAKTRIWITNAYLSPSTAVIRSLSRAAQRGVDVRILVPRTSDVFFMPWVASAHYPPLMASGVRIFEYLPSFLHAKSVIVDDWASVGTSNLNRRSLIHDYEVDIVLSSETAVSDLARRFEFDLQLAEEIISTPRGWSARLGRLVIFFLKQWI